MSAAGRRHQQLPRLPGGSRSLVLWGQSSNLDLASFPWKPGFLSPVDIWSRIILCFVESEGGREPMQC